MLFNFKSTSDKKIVDYSTPRSGNGIDSSHLGEKARSNSLSVSSSHIDFMF